MSPNIPRSRAGSPGTFPAGLPAGSEAASAAGPLPSTFLDFPGLFAVGRTDPLSSCVVYFSTYE